MAEGLNVDQLLERFPHKFESQPFHSPAGDSIIWFFEDADHYAERVDCWLTVYKSLDDHRLVGFKLKNIKTLLSGFEEMGLKVRISEEGHWAINLQAVVGYRPWITPQTEVSDLYRQILPRVRDAELDLCPA